jgi:hypothetical protein
MIELFAHKADVFVPVHGTVANADVYFKEKVDPIISELKAENTELKQKLEDAKSTAYTESVDAGMENRRLKRALWLARADRGRDNSILLPSKFMRNVWDNVERKCRAMA